MVASAFIRFMDKLEKFVIFLDQPLVKQTQTVFGLVATGLAFSWLILLAVEIWRPGIVSVYLDLNLILVLALGAWIISILGKKSV